MTTTTTENTALQAPAQSQPQPKPRPPQIGFGSRGLTLRSVDDVQRIAIMAVDSGFYPAVGARDPRAHVAQLSMKIVWGAELGISPLASLQGVHCIEGKPSLAAGLVASLIWTSGRAEYEVTEWTRDGCTMKWTVDGKPRGISSFDKADADAAGVLGKKNWKSFPKAMMFARALLQGARAYAPFVFQGPVYSPDELGSDGMEDVIDVEGGGGQSEPAPTIERAKPGTTKHNGSETLKAAAAQAKPKEPEVVDVKAEPEPATKDETQAEPHVEREPEVPPADADALSPALRKALAETPVNGNTALMTAHRQKWMARLTNAENDSLALWTRSLWNRARGKPDDDKMGEAQREELARLRALVSSQQSA